MPNHLRFVLVKHNYLLTNHSYFYSRYLEVATLSPAAPFDEYAYKQAVLAFSHEVDDDCENDSSEHTAANDSVNQMISSLAFA